MSTSLYLNIRSFLPCTLSTIHLDLKNSVFFVFRDSVYYYFLN